MFQGLLRGEGFWWCAGAVAHAEGHSGVAGVGIIPAHVVQTAFYCGYTELWWVQGSPLTS